MSELHLEKYLPIKKITFETQLELIKNSSIKKKKRRNCWVHSTVYKGRRDSSKDCPYCHRPCCPMHFAANGICYLCNGFNVEQIIELDEVMKKCEGK